MSTLKCGCVYSDARNNTLVRAGKEMSGSIISRCGRHQSEFDASLSATQGQCSELDRLRAENAGLRADAERYRWLRDGNNDTEGTLPELSGDELDAAIDAARDVK